MASKKTVLIIDGNNYVSRGFYAVKPVKTKSGFRTSGITGFFQILVADIHVLKPTNVIVTFDRRGGSYWRKEIYPEYKANRQKTEVTQDMLDLRAQYSPIKKLLKALGIRICSKKGDEADDIIATLATNFSNEGFAVVIASKDKDFAQLVGGNITMLCPSTRKRLGAKEVQAKFGVPPKQMIEYLALVGDSADNIPGVYKCGQVTAAKLLNTYGNIKNIVKNTSELTPALARNIETAKGFFSLSKQLINLKLDVKLSTTSTNSVLPKTIADPAEFKRLCAKYELVNTQKSIVATIRRFNK